MSHDRTLQTDHSHTSGDEPDRYSTEPALQPENILEDNLCVLDLGRLRGLECVIAGSKGAGTVEGKKCAGESEEERKEEEWQSVCEKIRRRDEERSEGDLCVGGHGGERR